MNLLQAINSTTPCSIVNGSEGVATIFQYSDVDPHPDSHYWRLPGSGSAWRMRIRIKEANMPKIFKKEIQNMN